MRWYADWMPAPPDWNPKRQLAALGVPIVEPNVEAATSNAQDATVRTSNVVRFPLRVVA
jgi:hypothetical protein